MFNNLRGRMVLLILGGTIFSILLVSVLANYTIFKQYDRYMESEQRNRVENIIDLIQSYYDEKDGWTEKELENIQHSPMIKNVDLALRDNNNDLLLYNETKTNFMEMHNKMMGMTGSSMMNRAMNNDNYVTEKYELSHQGKSIGTVEIGSNASVIISEEDMIFTRGINNSILYAAISSIIFAIIFGLWSANRLSKPIVQINKTAQDISKGNLDSRITTSNKIIEIDELSSSINYLGYSLKKQQELRKQLTSDISHELRTPITIIQNQIEAIGDGLWELTPDRIQVLNEESNRLLKLVAELKYLTNIEGHEDSLDIQNIDMSKLIMEVLEGFRVPFKNRNIILIDIIAENIMIEGDRDKLKQVMINLLSNALKFSNKNGKIEVSLSQDKDKIVLIIKDNGIGIPEEDLPYIFERFYRSDKSRNRNSGGAGIGLAIVKSIVDAHKGIIKATSKKEEGTEFWVQFPNKLSSSE